jgi:tetratricopeptide (TPR) repeat protein
MKDFVSGIRGLLVVLCLSAGHVQAQAPAAPAAPAITVVPAVINRLAREADEAFANKDYKTNIAKLEELVRLDKNKDHFEALEQCYFGIGVGYFFDNQFDNAIPAFTKCLTIYPKGKFASRCNLGIGKTYAEQKSWEQAIPFLKLASADRTLRSEAGFLLGEAYAETGKNEEALNVFRNLMGNDVRTPEQTTAAVSAISILADMGKSSELVAYIRKLQAQPGIRSAISWVATQLVVRGDELLKNENYEEALILYRSVPSRIYILEQQRKSLDEYKTLLNTLTERAKAVAKEGVGANQQQPGTTATSQDAIEKLKNFIAATETTLGAVDAKTDYDASVLYRRGRCLFHLERYTEALFCFSRVHKNYPKAGDLEPSIFAEIVSLAQLRLTKEILPVAKDFIKNFPEAKQAGQVNDLIGDCLVDKGDWPEVARHYGEAYDKNPSSEHGDTYLYRQAVALFQQTQFEPARKIFEKLISSYPTTQWAADARYRIAMTWFFSNKYNETLAACEDYLDHHPNGPHVGDIRYRLCFILYNDTKTDQSDKIIATITEHLQAHPEDVSAGSMLCLLGDVYAQKKKDKKPEAIIAYTKAVQSTSPDDVKQYALDQATAFLNEQKDWEATATLWGDFLRANPNSPLALKAAGMVAKMKLRVKPVDNSPEPKTPEEWTEKKKRDEEEMKKRVTEALAILGDALKPYIANPENEQVEPLIDEIVKMMVPKKKPAEIDADAVEKEVEAALKNIVGDKLNPTTNARVVYARARVNELLHRPQKSQLYLNTLALNTDPTALSPVLLSACGSILLKNGSLDKAATFFTRLKEKYSQSAYSDMGPVGLGQIALARKQYDDALQTFTDALEKNNGTSMFKEATLGKLQALVGLKKDDDAEKLALEMVGDKAFRGETSGWAYLSLADVYDHRAEAVADVEAYKKEHAYLQRTYLASRAYPEIAAKAMLRAGDVLKKIGHMDEAKATWKMLAEDPKLANTKEAEEAKKRLEQNP